MKLKTGVYNLFIMLLLVMSGCDRSSDLEQQFDTVNTYIEQGKLNQAAAQLQNMLNDDADNIDVVFALGQVNKMQGNWQAARQQFLTTLGLDENHVPAHVELGQLYLITNSLSRAEAQARSALQIKPDNADALALMGSILLRKGDLDAARQKAQQALELDASRPSAVILMVSVLVQTNDFEQAFAMMKDAIAKNPAEDSLKLSLAGLHSKAGQPEAGAKVLNELILKHPQSLTHRGYLARLYLEHNNPDQAEAVLREAVTALPDNSEAESMLIRFLAEHRGSEQALTELQQRVAANPGDNSLKLSLADEYINAGQTSQGMGLYQQIINNNSDTEIVFSARNQLAKVYSAQGDDEAALAELNKILEQQPDNYQALVNRGRLNFKKGDYDTAVNDFNAALKKRPDTILLYRYLARSYSAKGDLKAAITSMEKAIELSGNDLQIREEYTQLLAANQDTDAVISELQATLKLDERNLNALQSLFRIYSAQKNWALAEKVAMDIQRTHPEDAIGYHYLGQVRQVQGKVEQSIPEFEKALELSPGAIQPLTDLVKTHLALKQNNEARQRLQDTLELKPEHYVAWNLLGEIFLLDKQLDQALGAFKKAKDIKPNWVLPYRNMANVYYLNKDAEGAIKTLQEGIASAQQHGELVVALGQIYTGENRVDEAIALYQKALSENPENLLLMNNLSMLLVDYPEASQAALDIQPMIQKLQQSSNPMFYDTVGWYYYHQADYQLAVGFLEQAASANPDSLEVQYHLGMAYMKNGNDKDAETALKNALSRGEALPQYQQVRKTLVKIQSRASRSVQ